MSSNSTTQSGSGKMARTIQVLHPSRYTQPHHNSNFDMSTSKHNKRRFTPLLLEHGERELQDWGVVASSVMIENSIKNNSSSSLSSRNLGGRNHSNQQSIFGDHRPGSSRSLRSLSSQRSSGSFGSTKSASVPPSSAMRSIEGRLRLCSKSIVFEPNDVSRGIIRCPFDKMEKEPMISSEISNNGEEENSMQDVITSTAKTVKNHNGGRVAPAMSRDHEKIVVVTCKKVLIMKKNNIIAPYESSEVLTEFRFTFLHSSPNRLIDLSKKIYDMITKPNLHNTSIQAALDEIIKPMIDKPFDPSNFINIWEIPKTNNLRTFLLGPLVTRPGCTIITDEYLYFQPFNGVFSTVATRTTHYKLSQIVAIARRYHGLKDCAVEIFFDEGPSLLIAFESCREREQVIRLVTSRTNNGNAPDIPCHTNRDFIIDAVKAWQGGAIDNFGYLLALNSAAGRSFHDLSRYPVFPWVLSDYESSKLDVSCFSSSHNNSNDSTMKIFRDLTKPIGALNEGRLANFRARWKSMQDMGDAFLYGTHYSAPGYCLYYLVRTMPEQMLCLQNGKYDTADRLFHSLTHCYSSLLTNPADLKESIPQFYDPISGVDLLLNSSGLQLGVTQKGKLVNDVDLPKWARSPRDFLKKNRKALESDYVSSYLPNWIDLIFGIKSRGDEALEAMNLFHPSAYLGSEDLDRMGTEDERANAELQATEFGICPDVLFCTDHPQKAEHVEDDLFIVPDKKHPQFSDENEGDENGNKGQWEMLDAPLTPKATQSGEDDKSIISSPSLSSVGAGLSNAHNKMKEFAARQRTKSQDRALNKKGNSMWVTESATLSAEMNGEANLENDISIDLGTEDMFKPREHNSIKLSLRGSGDNSRGDGLFNKGTFGNDLFDANHLPPGNHLPKHNGMTEPDHEGWDLKPVVAKSIHGDAVSGCCLSLGIESYIATTSLDGGLMVHNLTNPDAEQPTRRGFSSTASLRNFSYLGNKTTTPENDTPKLHCFRSHESSDPLACLTMISDQSGGKIAFAGGHDDLVLAYGINSACALASVYSHRDAVTGISLVPRPSMYDDSHNASCTHLMTTSSWDATVKLWSVSITEGETVSIHKKPLVELFDADSSVVSVSTVYIDNIGLLIAAGCSDGSFVVWICRGDWGKEIIYHEEARRGQGPCADFKWSNDLSSNQTYLYAGFGNGWVASYVYRGGTIYPVSKLHVGSPVQCMCIPDLGDVLFAGCVDGGLRLIPIGEGGHFDYNPRTWTAVNGSNVPSITSLDVCSTQNPASSGTCRSYTCVTGSEDGCVALCTIEELPN